MLEEKSEENDTKIDIRCGNCLEIMKEISNKSVDMILCDLPYRNYKM